MSTFSHQNSAKRVQFNIPTKMVRKRHDVLTPKQCKQEIQKKISIFASFRRYTKKKECKRGQTPLPVFTSKQCEKECTLTFQQKWCEKGMTLYHQNSGIKNGLATKYSLLAFFYSLIAQKFCHRQLFFIPKQCKKEIKKNSFLFALFLV